MHYQSTVVRSRGRVEQAVSLRRRIGACVLAAIVSLSLVSTADAAITRSTPSPQVGKSITFSETAGLICCKWTFGDGTTGPSTWTRNISHVYWAIGWYSVTASGFYMNPLTRGPGQPFTTSTYFFVNSDGPFIQP